MWLAAVDNLRFAGTGSVEEVERHGVIYIFLRALIYRKETLQGGSLPAQILVKLCFHLKVLNIGV
jgi:hypothetical protein